MINLKKLPGEVRGWMCEFQGPIFPLRKGFNGQLAQKLHVKHVHLPFFAPSIASHALGRFSSGGQTQWKHVNP